MTGATCSWEQIVPLSCRTCKWRCICFPITSQKFRHDLVRLSATLHPKVKQSCHALGPVFGYIMFFLIIQMMRWTKLWGLHLLLHRLPRFGSFHIQNQNQTHLNLCVSSMSSRILRDSRGCTFVYVLLGRQLGRWSLLLKMDRIR